MKVLIAVKRVIDYNAKIRVKPDQSGVVSDNVKMSMNPFDEIAVEQAIRMKEQGVATEVVLVTVGSQLSQETLYHGLALGADRAIHIATDLELEPLNIAKVMRAIALQESPQLIFLGKQAIDNDSNQTGQMLSALLNWPQATFASEVKYFADGSYLNVKRETDSGMESIRVNLPAVVTTDLRLNEPRYISLPNILKAKQKPIEEMTLDSLELNLSSHTELLEVTAPPVRTAGIQVKSFDALMVTLKEKGLVK